MPQSMTVSPTQARPAQAAGAREIYERCPLCEARDFRDLGAADCRSHPLYAPELGDVQRWVSCQNCDHVFVEGPFGERALEVLFARANDHQLPGVATLNQRPAAAQIVRTVSELRGALSGRWLDVGFGNGALLTTAAEFGYEAVGLEARASAVLALRRFGYTAHATPFLEFAERRGFDVISLADVLEHMPEPRLAVRHAAELLVPGGVLFVSLPNRQSFAWRWLDQTGQNPYWSELEHYHNFSREGLYALLATEGLRPCHYAISARYRACMEVCAVKDA